MGFNFTKYKVEALCLDGKALHGALGEEAFDW